MDKILIAELPVDCRIGVSEEERAEPQRLLIDVELHLELAPAGRADDIGKTHDYAAVSEMLIALAQERPRALIEALAEEAAQEILRRFPCPAVRVRVRKPGALAHLGAAYAGVEIVRTGDG